MNRLFVPSLIALLCQGCTTATSVLVHQRDIPGLQIVRLFQKDLQHLPPTISVTYELGHGGNLYEDSRRASADDVGNLVEQASKHHRDILVVIDTSVVDDLTLQDLREAWDVLESRIRSKGFPLGRVHVFVVLEK